MKAVTASETKKRTGEKGGWIKADKKVIGDTSLCKTAINVYEILRGIADFETNITLPISYADIAKKIGRKPRTAFTRVQELEDKGIIVVMYDFKTRNGRKVYDKNSYLIVGGNAPCYQSPESSETLTSATEEQNEKLQKGYVIKCELNTQIDSPDLRTKETNIREAETSSVGLLTAEQPSQSYVEPEALKTPKMTPHEGDCGKPEEAVAEAKESIRPETPKNYDLSGLPEILHATAILYLDCTGRTELTEKDEQILRELLVNHYPARIQGEILYRLKVFRELGRTPRQMTLNYIYAILKNQRSRPLDEPEAEAQQTVTDPHTEAIYERVVSPRRKSNKKAAKRTSKAEHKEQSAPEVVSEPAPIPMAEAERVIAEYEAGHAKKPEPAIPVALEELFTKMQDREFERGEEYSATLPKDEYGDPVWPEEDELGNMPIEDYLRLKYPESEEEELCRDYSGKVYGSVSEHPEASRLQAAFEIDYACAMCVTPDNCQLPEGYKKGRPKPEAKMFTSKDGKRCLGTGFEGCIKCKHVKPAEKTPEEKRQEAEFERMMSKSGIVRKEKILAAYRPETPEEIVAKAMAILAAKRQRNLVLAGNAGTGKTHLATGIAIEAMRNGRQAKVITASEMLDEICQAYRDNTDPLGVLLKYKNVPVLVIDDWDKAKMTDARLDYLYQIINYRYERGLQTVVTTNAYDLAGLEHRCYAGKIEPIVSRLLENGDWVTIRDAENYRLKKHTPELATVSVEPAAPRVGKISLTAVEQVEPAEEAEPEIDILEAEALAEFEQMGAELGNPEHKLVEEAIAEVEAECRNKEASEPPTWQEIAQSSEYQALSESEKLKKQWEYVRETPEYKNMWDNDKIAIQLDFVRRIQEAELAQPKPEEQPEKRSYAEVLPNGRGIVIHVPHYDDGLDDDEDDLTLYGDTGIPGYDDVFDDDESDLTL